MKKILFIFDRNLSSLPPLMTIIESLIDNYDLTITVREREDVIENLYKGKRINFISFGKPLKFNNKLYRGLNRLKRIWFFKNNIRQFIKKEKFDLVWIASAEAAILLGKPIHGIKYFVNIYELYDTIPRVLKKIEPIAQKAEKVIVPEFNRAHMLRFWLKLKETPLVIPNKPASLLPQTNEIPEEIKALADKKIILYQGHINKYRNIDGVCEAVSSMPDYVLVVMGNAHGDYMSELKSKYSNIVHVKFIPPPFHLNITSCAHIGVVTYEYVSLNGVYCAPNKIWEYSGYGIPMLARDIPGLIYTVDKYGAGCCFDLSKPELVKEKIKHIELRYEEYKKACKLLYDSVDVVNEIQNTVNDFFNRNNEDDTCFKKE